MGFVSLMNLSSQLNIPYLLWGTFEEDKVRHLKARSQNILLSGQKRRCIAKTVRDIHPLTHLPISSRTLCAGNGTQGVLHTGQALSQQIYISGPIYYFKTKSKNISSLDDLIDKIRKFAAWKLGMVLSCRVCGLLVPSSVPLNKQKSKNLLLWTKSCVCGLFFCGQVLTV